MNMYIFQLKLQTRQCQYYSQPVFSIIFLWLLVIFQLTCNNPFLILYIFPVWKVPRGPSPHLNILWGKWSVNMVKGWDLTLNMKLEIKHVKLNKLFEKYICILREILTCHFSVHTKVKYASDKQTVWRIAIEMLKHYNLAKYIHF